MIMKAHLNSGIFHYQFLAYFFFDKSQEEDKSDTEGVSAYINVDSEISIKEEPASPASSILSNLSDSRSSRRSRGKPLSFNGIHIIL